VVASYQAFSEAGTAPSEDGEHIVLPLDAGVLTVNIGLPVVVVANKVGGCKSVCEGVRGCGVVWCGQRIWLCWTYAVELRW
jgi:hypothetical protein